MKIGFNNFRRFTTFPVLEVGGCTFLVGSNNSGKSTLIKACVLIQNNRNRSKSSLYGGGATDPILWDFSFAPGEGVSEHLYLGDFQSSLNDNADDRTISFIFGSGNTDIKFVLDGSSLNENEPSVLVPIREIITYNKEFDLTFRWLFSDANSGIVEYTYNPELIIDWLGREKQWESSYFRPRSSEKLDLLRKEINDYKEELSRLDENQTVTERFFSRDYNPSTKDGATRKYLLTQFLRDARNSIANDIKDIAPFKYVEAHNASHKVLLNPEDKNDYLAQTVLRYKNEIPADSQEHASLFVKKWMQIFNIGHEYEIKSIYNEAYTIDILNNAGRKRALGNYGTGTIQIIILLLQIAIAFATRKRITFFIEEPEQNLHPALQSKLAEMFYEVWKESHGNISFIVETHSEYLVRHTQVIAAKEIDNGVYTTDEFNEVMKVYYFPEHDQPYLMGYRQNGYFERQFGKGFYDEASNSARELYKIDKGIK
ncbi:MAG: ATP-binding protein [Bacteroidaceae bacterium]|nr:ATP-binding protein [Bacteroidaceae bacterium]